MEIEAHRVAHAARHNFQVAAVGVDPENLRVFAGVRLADVARRADWNVELAVWTELDEFPAVWDIARKLVIDGDRRRRLVEIVLDVVVARDLLRGGHVERPLVELDAVR